MGRTYVPVFNSRHQRTGALWEGRYRSFAIESERYWLTCMRYVERNPVRAGLVSRPEDYDWSSARAHARGAFDTVLASHHLYERLGTTPSERQRAWRAICRTDLSTEDLADMRDAVRTGRIGPTARGHGGQTP